MERSYPLWSPSARTPPSIPKAGTDSLRVPEEGCLSPLFRARFGVSLNDGIGKRENRFPRVPEEGCLSPISKM